MTANNARSSFGSEFIIAIAGLATGLLAAVANFLIAVYTDVDISSFMYWFMLPLGALMVGAVAASGYYYGSLLTQRPPTPRLALNMVVIGLSTYAFMQYLNYHALTFDDGTPLADVIPFSLYYRVKIEHTSMQLLRFHTSTGELGELGYVYEVLRIIGFLLGWSSGVPPTQCKVVLRIMQAILQDRRSLCDELTERDGSKRQLGHASITLTVDTYGKWLPMADKGAVDSLDDAPLNRSGSKMVAVADVTYRSPRNTVSRVKDSSVRAGSYRVGRAGLEPATRCLKGSCSTT